MMHMSRISLKYCQIPFLLVHLFFTVSWSQVYLNDYHSSLAAIARWGVLNCPRISWAGWERELGRDVPLWEGCGSPGCLWGWSLPWQQEVLPEPRPQCLAGICMWHHSALDELLADLLLTRELLWQSSLFTQFIKLSGMRSLIAHRISVAAASLISSEACSLYQAGWGVQMRFRASFKGPWAKLKGSDLCTLRAAPHILPSLRAWAKASSSTSLPQAAITRKAPCLICFIVKSLMRWWLCSLRLQCRETQ